MKLARVTCCLFVLLLSLVAFAFTTSAPRAHAASGTTTVFTSHGLSATANFDNLSPDGCIDTFVLVGGSQNTDNKQTFSTAVVFIGQFDLCTNTQLLSAKGATNSPTFQVNKNLTSASLNATIPVTDFVSSNTFNVAVSVAWTSTSTIGNENSTFHIHTKAFTENAHFVSLFRDANASGIVSAGTTNFTPSPSMFAQTMSAQEADVTITRP